MPEMHELMEQMVANATAHAEDHGQSFSADGYMPTIIANVYWLDGRCTDSFRACENQNALLGALSDDQIVHLTMGLLYSELARRRELNEQGGVISIKIDQWLARRKANGFDEQPSLRALKAVATALEGAGHRGIEKLVKEAVSLVDEAREDFFRLHEAYSRRLSDKDTEIRRLAGLLEVARNGANGYTQDWEQTSVPADEYDHQGEEK